MPNVEDVEFEEVGSDLMVTSEAGVSVQEEQEYRERMLAKANESTEHEISSDFQYISMNNRKGVFTMNKGEDELGDAFLGVIVNDAFVNAYYEGSYDPDSKTPPVCFAHHHLEEEMIPDDKIESPEHGDCQTCPHNQFGSASNGKGKACKNGRRIAVVAVDDEFDEYSKDEVNNLVETGKAVIANNGVVTEKITNPDEEVYLMNLSATSLKNFRDYKHKLKNKLKFPIENVVTRISLEESPKGDWFEYHFKAVRLCTSTEEPILTALSDKANKGVLRPFKIAEEEEEKEKKPKKKSIKKRR